MRSLAIFTTGVLAAAGLDVDQLEALVPGVGTPLPKIGTNIDGGSVFTNFLTAYNEGQFFIIYSGMMTYEKPSAVPFEVTTLFWCNDLVFSSMEGISDEAVGYSGRCVIVRLTDPSDFVDSGAGVSDYEELNVNDIVDTFGISAVFVPQMNILQGVVHKHTDNYVRVFWDDGRPTMAMNGWEAHDEGDESPNADTSSWSNVATCRWLSVGQTASLLRVEPSALSSDRFGDIYEQVWNRRNDLPPSAEADEDTGNENDEKLGEDDALHGVHEEEEESGVGTESDGTHNINASPSSAGHGPTGRRRLLNISDQRTFISVILGIFGL